MQINGAQVLKISLKRKSCTTLYHSYGCLWYHHYSLNTQKATPLDLSGKISFDAQRILILQIFIPMGGSTCRNYSLPPQQNFSLLPPLLEYHSFIVVQWYHNGQKVYPFFSCCCLVSPFGEMDSQRGVAFRVWKGKDEPKFFQSFALTD